jgi:spore coat polysaccharide biosynthesis protein SpsF
MIIPDVHPSHSRTIAIVQARRASSRLPDKVLLDIGGQPMLVRVVERTRRAKRVDAVVVATTTDPSDEAIEALCKSHSYPCYRGSMFDVLDRYYQAARQFGAEVVVRITADCPVIDPQVIDQTIQEFLTLSPRVGSPGSHEAEEARPYMWDFAANRLPPPWGRTFPIGLDTEVCTFAGLETAWKEATLPHQREHVMPFFYEHPERFHILLVNAPGDYGTLRWTVDTAEDLELLRQVYARFGGRDDFSWLEVLALVEHEPELGKINAGVQHKHYQQVDTRR